MTELQQFILLEALQDEVEFRLSYRKIMKKFFRINCVGRGYRIPRRGGERSEFKSASAILSRDLRVLETAGPLTREQTSQGKDILLTDEGAEFAERLRDASDGSVS